jgi:hypothetical protein
METLSKRGGAAAALLAAIALAATSPAQARIVLPPSHAGVEGTGATHVPFGRSVPMRVQAAYDAALFSGPRVIGALAWRIDGNQTSAAKRLELEVRLSTLARPITGLQAAFSANTGADEVVALDRTAVDLPAQGQGQAPNPFTVRVPLQRAFAYDPSRGALLVDVLVHDQPPGAYPLDATFTCTSEQRGYGPPGCGAAGRILRVDSATTQVLWGRPFALRVLDAPAQAATSLFLGSIESGWWNGLPIPFDLGAAGAPGCWLSIDALLVRGALADAAGTALYSFALPALPALRGEWVRFQGVALEAQANPLGLVTSQPAKVQVCGWEAVSRVYASGAGAIAGFVEVGVAPVLQLE